MPQDLNSSPGETPEVRIINLASAPGAGEAWDKPKLLVYLWAVAELLFIYNPWQVSSSLRSKVLRTFGAKIGPGVIIRPRTRVRFPWKLSIGERSWIGEGVWIHNQDQVKIGSDVVVSQETLITTGSHAHRRDMALVTKPVRIEDGAWITARCIILGGSDVGSCSLVTPGTVVRSTVPANSIWGAPEPRIIGDRVVVNDFAASSRLDG